MKIAVVCANGKAGKLIVREAAERGLDVTAVVRGENRTSAEKVILKDLYDLTAEDLAGSMWSWMHLAHGRRKRFRSTALR